MEKAGIHLPAAQQNRMQELMNDNNHYAANFNRALRDPRKLGSVGVRWGSLTLDPGSVAGVMATEADEKCRETVWRAAARSPLSNMPLLEAMLSGRKEQAALVGSPSYAHYKARGTSLAEDPAAILSFLQHLARAVKPVADLEAQALAGLKAQLLRSGALGSPPTGSSGGGGGGGGGGGHPPLMPWDTEYLIGAAHRAAGDVPRSAMNDYLHLPRVLEGLGELMYRALGLTLHTRPAGRHEAWAHGVLRCDVSHPDLGPLGTVYLDLCRPPRGTCSRPGKYPSAVTFPIRCGRQLPDGGYQTPVMALLADFGPPHCSPRDVRLAMRELRVLLHEWGHCVHALASRTKFQHLSGTRCAQDVVELPSHLFEHWASDVRSLRVLARHHASRDPLPAGTATALIAARSRFSGLELQQQLLLSLADQALHGTARVPSGGTSEAWREATEHFTSLPWIPGSHPEVRMSHLTIYGAGYYAYVYARCLSTAAWNTLLAHDPLDPAAGAAVLKGLLQPGGGVPPVHLVTEALGHQSLVQHPGGGWAPATNDLLLRTTLATFG